MEDQVLLNLAHAVERSGRMKFSRFLDPAEKIKAEEAARTCQVRVSFWGGYEESERSVAVFYEQDDVVPEESFPVICLRAGFNPRFASLSHRDLLGAFMGLGLTRDCLGDIIISGGEVFLFTLTSISEFVTQSLTSAGKTALSFEQTRQVIHPEMKGSFQRGVVASLRLDAVLAELFHLSRSRASDLIRAGKVKVNYLPEMRTDLHLEAGTMLSVSGLGRASLRSIDGMTKKQNVGITYFRYI